MAADRSTDYFPHTVIYGYPPEAACHVHRSTSGLTDIACSTYKWRGNSYADADKAEVFLTSKPILTASPLRASRCLDHRARRTWRPRTASVTPNLDHAPCKCVCTTSPPLFFVVRAWSAMLANFRGRGWAKEQAGHAPLFACAYCSTLVEVRAQREDAVVPRGREVGEVEGDLVFFIIVVR